MYLICLAIYGINIYKIKKWIQLTTAVYIHNGGQIIRSKVLHSLYSLLVILILVLFIPALVYPTLTLLILGLNGVLFVIIDLYFKNLLIVLNDGFVFYGVQFNYTQIKSIVPVSKGVKISDNDSQTYTFVVHSKKAIARLLQISK